MVHGLARGCVDRVLRRTRGKNWHALLEIPVEGHSRFNEFHDCVCSPVRAKQYETCYWPLHALLLVLGISILLLLISRLIPFLLVVNSSLCSPGDSDYLQLLAIGSMYGWVGEYALTRRQ